MLFYVKFKTAANILYKVSKSIYRLSFLPYPRTREYSTVPLQTVLEYTAAPDCSFCDDILRLSK